MSRKDTFLTQSDCDRCGGPLPIRILSWFTEDTICMECSKKENVIKNSLRDRGIKDAMEGCGFIPDPEKIQAST